MPGACLSLWPSEDCEWSTWDIWRSSDVVEHAIYFSLALMLGYTFFVLFRFLLRYHLARHELRDFRAEAGPNFRNRRRLISDLSQGLGTLKGFSATAPFLGLAGTSYGILVALWFGFSGSPERYVALLFTRMALAVASTLAGILVAVPATVCHNLLRVRIESFSSAPFWGQYPAIGEIASFKFAQTLPLKTRFSSLPPLALLAAPTLACVVVLFTPFHPHRVPTGLHVLLPSFPCQPDVADRIIVLSIKRSGELFINTEPVSWKDLPNRLSATYSTRAQSELILYAEDEVSFQIIANAIDIARNSPTPGTGSLDIKVVFVTPKAARECVPIPVRTIPIK